MQNTRGRCQTTALSQTLFWRLRSFIAPRYPWKHLWGLPTRSMGSWQGSLVSRILFMLGTGKREEAWETWDNKKKKSVGNSYLRESIWADHKLKQFISRSAMLINIEHLAIESCLKKLGLFSGPEGRSFSVCHNYTFWSFWGPRQLTLHVLWCMNEYFYLMISLWSDKTRYLTNS